MNRVSVPGAPSIDCLHVLVHNHSIAASKCICRFIPLMPPKLLHRSLQIRTSMAAKWISPHPLDHCHQVHLQTRSNTFSKCISKLARLWPPSASPNSLHHGLQVYFVTPSIKTFQCISKVAWSWPPSASSNCLYRSIGVYLWGHSIVILKLTLNCSEAPPTVTV